jgi:hypothetical protein
MRKLIVIACIAAVLVAALLPVVEIAIVAIVSVSISMIVVALRRESPRIDLQLAALARYTSFRAPPV